MLRLWYQTGTRWTPDIAQQYVTGDFNGNGRADVMIAQKRQDAGLDLYVVTSNGTTANAPSLWLEARNLDTGTRFLPAHIDASNSKRSGLLAMGDVDGALAVSQFPSTGSAFTANCRTSVYKEFDAANAKFAAGDIDGDGIDDLVVLAPLGESTGRPSSRSLGT
ncbi:hypothetical protein BRCH_02098c [Candidatus Burkholderia brachyanthoides]|nr:hypothetical protein BRCH_02098c [Candidatus Burkholderia brachyanthoides]